MTSGWSSSKERVRAGDDAVSRRTIQRPSCQREDIEDSGPILLLLPQRKASADLSASPRTHVSLPRPGSTISIVAPPSLFLPCYLGRPRPGASFRVSFRKAQLTWSRNPMPVWTSMTWTSSPGVWSRPREQTIWVSLVLRVTVATRCGRRPAPDRTGVGTEGAGAAMVRSEREKGGPFNSRVEVVVGVEEGEKRRVTPPPFVLAVPRQPSKVFLPATTITKSKGRCRIKCV